MACPRSFLFLQGVKADDKGHILVDAFQETTAPGVYALGDVVGRAELTPGLGDRFLPLVCR